LQELKPKRVGVAGVLSLFGFLFGYFGFPRILHGQIVSVSEGPGDREITGIVTTLSKL
jgi:hypothetical protein